MKEIIGEAAIGFVSLDRSGDIVYANSFVENELIEAGIHDGSIYDLYDVFPVIDRFYYQIEWKRVLVALDMRHRYYKSKEVFGDKNYSISFDFHLVDIYSSNKPEIFLSIHRLELGESDVPYEEQADFVDHITGLPSKGDMASYFDERIHEGETGRFAIMLMSIANYRDMVKYVGPDLAEEFMAILNSYIEEVDQIKHIGKISSDTFELITKDIEDGQIEDIVNDLIMNLQIPFKHKDYDIETKPLIGIALYPHNGVTHGELFKSAQIALAKADYTSGNQIQYSDIELMKTLGNKKDIEHKLIKALENDEFYMVYQPPNMIQPMRYSEDLKHYLGGGGVRT